jgi:hypothetical protein
LFLCIKKIIPLNYSKNKLHFFILPFYQEFLYVKTNKSILFKLIFNIQKKIQKGNKLYKKIFLVSFFFYPFNFTNGSNQFWLGQSLAKF